MLTMTLLYLLTLGVLAHGFGIMAIRSLIKLTQLRIDNHEISRYVKSGPTQAYTYLCGFAVAFTGGYGLFIYLKYTPSLHAKILLAIYVAIIAFIVFMTHVSEAGASKEQKQKNLFRLKSVVFHHLFAIFLLLIAIVDHLSK